MYKLDSYTSASYIKGESLYRPFSVRASENAGVYTGQIVQEYEKGGKKSKTIWKSVTQEFNPLILISTLVFCKKQASLSTQLASYSKAEILVIFRHLYTLIQCCQVTVDNFEIHTRYLQRLRLAPTRTVLYQKVLERLVISPTKESAMRCLVECELDSVIIVTKQLIRVHNVCKDVIGNDFGDFETTFVL